MSRETTQESVNKLLATETLLLDNWTLRELIDACNFLNEKSERYQTTLEWYGNEKLYELRIKDDGSMACSILKDNGNLAREAINQTQPIDDDEKTEVLYPGELP